MANYLQGAVTGLNALLGGIGSNAASSAQQGGINRANRQLRSGYLTNLYTQEDPRSIGHQAYADIGSALGYSVPQYQSINSLMAAQNPLTSKDVKKMLNQGLSLDQIQQTGTLAGLHPKSIKRLTKAGLTMDQIQQLATRQAPQDAAAAQPAPTGQQDFSRFIDSPDYQFRLDQGQKDLGNSFAARGGAASGNALRALSTFNQGLASGEYNNWFNRRMQLAGHGDMANNNVASAATNYSQGVAQNNVGYGDAQASGILGTVGSVMGGLQGLTDAYQNQSGVNTGTPNSLWRNSGNGGYYQSGYFDPNKYAVQPSWGG